jgi:hypothetical protein
MSETITYNIRELDPDIIAPSTSRMNVPEQGGSKCVVIGKPGCFAKGTKVLLYNGDIKNIEDIQVNEQVMGDDSTPRNVLELCHNTDEMYNIIPVRGDTITVNKYHILSLKHDDEYLDITVCDYLKKPKSFQKKYKWYQTSVDFPETELRFDPYIVGAWFGKENNNVAWFGTENNNVYNSFGETMKGEKHIPKLYKINSRKNRLKFLAGFLDSLMRETKCIKNKDEFEFINNNKTLFNDILFLARSLGFHAYKKIYLKNSVNNYGVIAGANLSEIPLKNFSPPTAETKSFIIREVAFSIEQTQTSEYYGFILDNNHKFLLEDCSVVHNTGKSSLISSIMYEKSHIFPIGMAISGTEISNHHYSSSLLPSTFVYNSLDKSKVEDFLKRQEVAKAHLKNPWSFLVIDDCMDDPKLFNDPLFQKLFKNGRHAKMLFFLGLQYCLDVKPNIRVNIDGIFILREPNLKMRKSLHENYAGIFPDFASFCSVMDQITDDYTALYIHNATTSNKIEDCVFWYKAKPVPKDFKFGCKEFWDFHNQRYDPDNKASSF